MSDEHGVTIGAMPMEAAIRIKLTEAFAPSQLEVVNESDQHHGHAGSPGSGQSHFRVVIKAAVFAGLTRVERHRLVNGALADEFARGLHALALSVEG
jgi:BolA family transcriptional regulator, general stress-responsive regulator